MTATWHTAYPAVFLIDKNGFVRLPEDHREPDDLVPATEVVNKLKDMGIMHGKEPFKSSRYR